MTRLEVRFLLLVTLVLLATGIALGVATRLLVPEDPFSALGAPWQPFVLKTHVLAAPLFLFLFGGIYRKHVVPKLRSPETHGRTSGMLALWLVPVLALTGYGYQVLTGEGARNIVSLAHLAGGIVYAVVYLAHARLGPATAALCAEAAARAPLRRPRRETWLRRRPGEEGQS